MYTRLKLAAIALVLVAYGCQGSGAGAGSAAGAASLDTDDQKASYAIGLDMGNSLLVTGDHLDRAALLAGLDDALAERDAQIADDEIQRVMTAFNQVIQEEMQAQSEADAATNLEEGQAYLEENGARPEVTTTASGLQYEVMREGDGPTPGPTDQVTVDYKGTLIDGTQFDSSYDRGEPATFSLDGVIPGFSEGLQLMPVGSQYRFVIPSDLGYGPSGSPPTIGGNATLIFEVELIEIPS
jgi:FKBP-type peptidyl-prolyl cis-trans isomerase FkpA